LRTAYALDLRGPAVSLNTACSTTLLTIDSAYHALLDYECDRALAGGIDIGVPQRSGFLYQDGGTLPRTDTAVRLTLTPPAQCFAMEQAFGS